MLRGRLAFLQYEAGELEEALRLYDRLSEYSPPSARDLYASFSRSLISPLLFAVGRAEEALAILVQAVEFARQTGLEDLGSLLAAEANLRLRMGDIGFAVRWSEENGCSIDEEIRYLRIDSLLVFARLLLAQQRKEEAGRLLARMQSFLAGTGMRRPLITVDILQSLQADQAGDRAAALAHLSEALRGAAPENYLRAFLDEDERLLAFLPAARSVAPAFTTRIMAAAAPAVAGPPAVRKEGLSVREREILQLIADGLTNAEIAARLVIAPATAKRHINNIFGKLGVSSRTQALAKAKRLNLLH
jgi:LuxR family maltose regulon positive regulatory protein